VTNGPVIANGQLNMPGLEENLAREMAKMKMEKEKNQRELEKICQESPELRELQNKIKSAYLNKERATQVTESQYRKQAEVVSNFLICNFMHTFHVSFDFIIVFTWESNGYVGDRRSNGEGNAEEEGT
jgi:hypothetical protein